MIGYTCLPQGLAALLEQQGGECWDWVHFLITGRAAVVMFWKCASGINDKDTGDVTDGKLGKELPGRTLEVDQEGQISLTEEMMRDDFLDLNHFIHHFLTISKNIIENLLLRPELHYCASGSV